MFPPISFLASLFLLGLVDQFFRNLKHVGEREANRLVYGDVKKMKVPIEEQKVVYINSLPHSVLKMLLLFRPSETG